MISIHQLAALMCLGMQHLPPEQPEWTRRSMKLICRLVARQVLAQAIEQCIAELNAKGLTR